MNATRKLTWTDFKLLLRNPIAVGFTILFPLLLLFVFGSIFGNAPDPQLGGYGLIDVAVPAYVALVIVTAGLLSLPVSLAVRREQGILRRFRATPISPVAVLGSQVIVNLVLAAIGIALLLIAGRLFYNLHMPEQPIGVILAFILSCFSFFALSFIIAGLARTGDAARSIGMAIFFPMMMLSGAALPRAMMPPAVQSISEWLPMTQVVNLLQGLWFGLGWDTVAVVVLIAMLIIGIFVSVRTFRWE